MIGAEYLSMDLAVKVVDSIEEAVEHIRRYSTGHTKRCTASDQRGNNSASNIDGAAIAVNASALY